MASYLPNDPDALKKEFVQNAEFLLAKSRRDIGNYAAFHVAAISAKNRLIERWKDSEIFMQQEGVKQIGRYLKNTLLNLDLEPSFEEALDDLGFNLEDLYDEERDAGLGNGGLGRLAACFLDSMATHAYPCWGYGLRYNYGMFHQVIKDGKQVEMPDYWLNFGSLWEIERPEISYPVGFYGTSLEVTEGGKKKWKWSPGLVVRAVAFDRPVPGFKSNNTLNLRLWSSRPAREFDLESFNAGDYWKALEARRESEYITHVLYPNDNTGQGKELRLKQQALFVSATIQDLLVRFQLLTLPLAEFPNKMAIQLNDTHPSLGVAELMRVLIDVYDVPEAEAWSITRATFAYTNHTVLPEALEKWPLALMQRLLPRHMQIIYNINFNFLQEIQQKWPHDTARMRRMSIIDEDDKSVRMAHLAIVGSRKINGVAALHTQILRESIFKDFYELWPDKFQNKTNGVTPRRWVQQANTPLATLITRSLGTEKWLTEFELCQALRQLSHDIDFQVTSSLADVYFVSIHIPDPPIFCSSDRCAFGLTRQEQWQIVKLQAKERLARWIQEHCHVAVDPTALFDVQVKRFHEYKRQLMNILAVISRYLDLKAGRCTERWAQQPRVVLFGGKAAPGYFLAKCVIYLINRVADVINNDPAVGERLRVVFLPNYCVSLAELIIPASDISQHISTAGMEASGTSNMKFCMNGGILLGTLDGANVELLEEVGAENIFIFGTKTPDVPAVREALRRGEIKDAKFEEVVAAIEAGMFGPAEQYRPILSAVLPENDHYILRADFAAYLASQAEIDRAYQDRRRWTAMSIANTASTGKFSSDRTIHQYAADIWGIKPCPRPGPVDLDVGRIHGKLAQLSGVIGSPRASVSLQRLSGRSASPRPHELLSHSPPAGFDFDDFQ